MNLLRAATLAACLALPSATLAQGALDEGHCPFADDSYLPSHEAECFRFARADVGGEIAFDVAVLRPTAGAVEGSVVYIPGGPGDAPVSGYGPPEVLLSLFPKHILVAFNPRGVVGSTPRFHCDFGPALWQEEFSGEPVLELIRGCRDRLLPLRRTYDFDAPKIAEDVDAMVRKLGLKRAGVIAVSYGTETALHLLERAPGWLAFAVLDSVSLPGESGLTEEMTARRRFLDRLDRRCFAEGRCGIADRKDSDLASWAQGFDAAPLRFTLGPERAEWSLDGAEMLDYLYELSAYPDGLDVAARLIAALETNRLAALGWIRADLADTIRFADESLALSFEAYSDAPLPDAREALGAAELRYPTDRQAWADLVAAYRAWNAGADREPPFTEGARTPAPVPVLVLSGGIDAITPAEWSARLDRRFAGIERHVFPSLGHAVSFGLPNAEASPEIAAELHCAVDAVRGFVSATAQIGPDCAAYRKDMLQ